MVVHSLLEHPSMIHFYMSALTLPFPEYCLPAFENQKGSVILSPEVNLHDRIKYFPPYSRCSCRLFHCVLESTPEAGAIPVGPERNLGGRTLLRINIIY